MILWTKIQKNISEQNLRNHSMEMKPHQHAKKSSGSMEMIRSMLTAVHPGSNQG